MFFDRSMRRNLDILSNSMALYSRNPSDHDNKGGEQSYGCWDYVRYARREASHAVMAASQLRKQALVSVWERLGPRIDT